MLVSICIPTKDRPMLIDNTLMSIFNEPVDKGLYEVVISDNSDDDATFCIVEKFRKMGMEIVYYRNPVKGFYNSIQALILGNAEFLKLHNDYTKFNPGGLQQLIDLVVNNREQKPQVLFTDGNLKCNNVREFSSFDSFLASSSYWNTWSSAFSIWKKDFDSLPHQKADLNDQFPHTSILFYNNIKARYIIDDRVLFDNSTVNKKGGYNIFYNFCVLYIDMLKDLLNSTHINKTTFVYIKRDMAYSFVSSWYCNSILSKGEFSFDNTDCHKNILKNYSFFDFFTIIIIAILKKAYKKCTKRH